MRESSRRGEQGRKKEKYEGPRESVRVEPGDGYSAGEYYLFEGESPCIRCYKPLLLSHDAPPYN